MSSDSGTFGKGTRRPVRGGINLRAARDPRDRYELVFLLLIASYLLSAFPTSSRASLVTLVLYLAALLVALRSSRLSRMWARRFRWTLVAGSVAAGAIALLGALSVDNGLVVPPTTPSGAGST